jgi:site-specific DNA recombinase
MNELQVAIYARVSSEQQSEANTIESQLSELRARMKALGLMLPTEHEFVDNGYSGSTLIRPALEQLRDVVAAGGIDRLYVHCPDRLARNYAHQVLLLEEFFHAGVEVNFLNREVGQTPEDQLLLQVQGMIAEYERAKILERSRRGKRYAAQRGDVSVLSGAPYGYRYVSKHDGDGQARFDVMLEEARVVRQVFTWVGQDRCSIGEVCRRLNIAKEKTRTGKTVWDRATVWDMLKNPAYKGAAAFGKTSVEPLRPRLRGQRGRPMQPKRAVSTQDVPREKWMSIPVPALVDEALFEEVQEQLQENQQRARIGQRGVRYLLQGLLVCACCGYAYYGKPISPSARKGNPRSYAYYRCIGSDAYRFGGVRLCWNKQLRTDLVDEAVWNEVCTLLEDPSRLEQEYRQRLLAKESSTELTGLETSLGRLRQGLARLIDSYAEGMIDKAEFEPRITRMRERIKQVEEQVKQIQDEAGMEHELRLILGRLETFASKVKEGLTEADWLTRREIIRTLVKRVEVNQEQVNVIFRIGPHTPSTPSDHHTQSLHHCGERDDASLWRAFFGGMQDVFVHVPCFQPLPEYGLVHWDVGQEPFVRNGVKTAFDVAFEYPLCRRPVSQCN